MPSADPNAPAAVWSDSAHLRSSRGDARPFDFFDLFVYGFLLAAGAFYFHFRSHASDFLHDDVFYFQRAVSILHLGYDGFNGAPETTQPPGLPYLFVIFCLLGGCTYRVIQAAFPIFTTLGLVVTYKLFRRETSQLIAIAICLVLLASPAYFSLATAWIATTFPVFFTTMSTLLAAAKLDEATSLRARIGWGALVAALAACSIMIASAALALFGAVVAKIALTLLRDRRQALVHLKNYAAVILLVAAVQGLWAHRKPMPIEWPIQGFPHPYVQQLALKSGPNPELGYATWRDVVQRVKTNLISETSLLLDLLYPGWINVALPSVALAGPILCILLGWGYSLWRSRGNTLAEWYFAAYEVIYLFWPWHLEVRYFYPVAPFALLYLWRGIQALLSLAGNQARILGATWLPFGGALMTGCLLWLRAYPGVTGPLPGGLQAKLSLLFWTVTVILAIWMVWGSTSWHRFFSGLKEWSCRPISFLKWTPLRVACTACGIYVAMIATLGFAAERRIGKRYSDPRSSANEVPPDVQAARWLRSHTPADAILMSREPPIVSYQSRRKVIWFPPSGNPRMLIEGIRHYKVGYVIDVRRANSYYLPPDDVAMAALLANYPAAFSLAWEGSDVRIFRVLKDQLPPSQGRFFDN